MIHLRGVSKGLDKLKKMLEKPIAKFMTKAGKEIEIRLPQMERLPALLLFVNRLVYEDTFLTFIGQPKTLLEERYWLKNEIQNIENNKSYLIWAIYQNKIIGSSSVHRGATRDWHVGRIGLMVDQDFRGDGIGRFLLESILEQAQKMKIKIVTIVVFSDNEIAISLYQKLGFKEYGRLPQGLYRQNHFSDTVEMYKNL